MNPHSGNCSFCSTFNTEFVHCGVVDELYWNDFTADNGDVARVYSNDVTLMFNQERLKGVNVDTLNHWMSSLAPSSDSLSSLRANCSDEDLINLCKSRYIQSPSELLAWSDYLNENYKEILDQQRKSYDEYVSKLRSSSGDNKNNKVEED